MFSAQMSHDHMAHMMNASGMHASHDANMSHAGMDHSSMHGSMAHDAMGHGSVSSGAGMDHTGHTLTAEACANVGMHGMSVRISWRSRLSGFKEVAERERPTVGVERIVNFLKTPAILLRQIMAIQR